MSVIVDGRFAGIDEKELLSLEGEVGAAHRKLHDKSGLGADFLGWLDLPERTTNSELAEIKAAAKRIREQSEILVVIGIGGSYLGARAVIESLGSQYFNETAKTKIYFAGNGISGDALRRIVSICEGKRFSINVISKSGTTTEPAVAFRVLKGLLEKQFGEKAAATRIYATTDAKRGTLKKGADEKGYATFVIPDDVGGRYSVLTAVGLLPIAVAGFDIDALIEGARCAQIEYSEPSLAKNACYRYAALRNLLYRKGKAIEMLISYEPAFTLFNEWFKQLYGESEGKDGKGLFPSSAVFSTDLHSMGQFIQDGTRNLFETVMWFNEPMSDLTLEREADDADGLNFLAGKKMSEINKQAFLGTLLAHAEGGAPNIILEADGINEKTLGGLIYFFEKACGISGYLLGVNPFDQPGVESYKKNMFALLGKPGYEALREDLLKKLK